MVTGRLAPPLGGTATAAPIVVNPVPQQALAIGALEAKAVQAQPIGPSPAAPIGPTPAAPTPIGPPPAAPIGPTPIGPEAAGAVLMPRGVSDAIGKLIGSTQILPEELRVINSDQPYRDHFLPAMNAGHAFMRQWEGAARWGWCALCAKWWLDDAHFAGKVHQQNLVSLQKGKQFKIVAPPPVYRPKHPAPPPPPSGHQGDYRFGSPAAPAASASIGSAWHSAPQPPKAAFDPGQPPPPPTPTLWTGHPAPPPPGGFAKGGPIGGTPQQNQQRWGMPCRPIGGTPSSTYPCMWTSTLDPRLLPWPDGTAYSDREQQALTTLNLPLSEFHEQLAIRQAFKSQALLVHPDKMHGASQEDRQEARAWLDALMAALEVFFPRVPKAADPLDAQVVPASPQAAPAYRPQPPPYRQEPPPYRPEAPPGPAPQATPAYRPFHSQQPKPPPPAPRPPAPPQQAHPRPLAGPPPAANRQAQPKPPLTNPWAGRMTEGDQCLDF